MICVSYVAIGCLDRRLMGLANTDPHVVAALSISCGVAFQLVLCFCVICIVRNKQALHIQKVRMANSL